MAAWLAAGVLLLSAATGQATLVAVSAGTSIYETESFADITGEPGQLVAGGLGLVQDVVYAGGSYYWTDVQTGTLQTVVRGSGQVQDLVVRDPSGAVPRFLEVDAVGGTIYWTEARLGFPLEPASIYRADLDGSNVELLYTSPTTGGSAALGGLVLDPDAGRLYFHDASASNANTLRSLALDGSDLQTLATLSGFQGFGGAIDFDPVGDDVFFAVGTQVFRYSLGDPSAQVLFPGSASLSEILGGLLYVPGEDELYVSYTESPPFAMHEFVLDAGTGAFLRSASGEGGFLGGITLVPEPGPALLLGLGLAALAMRRGRAALSRAGR